MKPKTKKFLSDFFFGLFSNDYALEGAKSNPWWVCLIIAIFAVILPVLPITISQAKTYGASFLSKYTYRFDQNIAEVTVALAKDNKEFKVNGNKELEYYDNGALMSPDATADLEPVATHLSESTHQYELMVYYSRRVNKDINAYVQEIANTTYAICTTNKVDPSSETAKYMPSIVVLYKGGLYTRLNKEDSTEIGSNTYTNFNADWKNFPVDYEIIKNALPKDVVAESVDLNNSEQVNEIYTNWKGYYNKSYLTQKTKNIWMMSGIFFGVYVVLVVILGTLIFLLTRGKNNMFNYMKFIDTQKIVWWASLSPAILAMILGFILNNFAQIMFIVLMGLRVMWISMKQLRPQY